MNKKEIIDLLEQLNIPKEEYVILSSSALVIREVYDKAGDIDLAVTQKGLEFLKRKYNLIDKGNNWFTITDRIECVLDETVKKEKYGEYYLQDIVQYYEYVKSRNREKDKLRLPELEEYILRRKK